MRKIGIDFLMIVFSFLAGHDTVLNSYCLFNGNNKHFSTKSAANDDCLKDKSCVAFIDSCGNGNKFSLCNAPLMIVPSGCGGAVQKSVTYLKLGKYLVVNELQFFETIKGFDQ